MSQNPFLPQGDPAQQPQPLKGQASTPDKPRSSLLNSLQIMHVFLLQGEPKLDAGI